MLNPTAIEGLKKFLHHAETLHPSNNPRRENGFAREFQEIKDLTSRLKKDPSYSTKQGEREVNRQKNRYKDILPYDYTRIILPENGNEGSDYINGNYIKGPTNKVVYLTAQGPLPCTVDDFWRMIVSHKIQVIVMACREYELGKLKCKRYWPESMEEKLEYGGCKITLVSQEEMGDGFVIRTISAKSSKKDFKVTQFHYTAWPDHDVPRSATPLIELTMSFRAFVGSDNEVPVLVHCSAGCGRTGTICALDFARTIIQLGTTENFSVFDIVSNLRKQRIAMVQTKEQYELVYKAVTELVNDELKKQRISNPNSLYYVNVEIPVKEDNTYENVDFIRSIQRLHQEERNASRKPMKEPPSNSSSMAVMPAPKKDVVLVDKSNLLTSKKNDDEKNACKEKSPQLSKGPSKENLVQSSTQSNKPKTTSSYENVLPLLATPKPPLAPRPAPQNYVNVVIGSSGEKNDDDYVNIAPGKPVPIPNVKNEPTAKSSKQVSVADSGGNSSVSSGNQATPAHSSAKPDVTKKPPSNKGADYEIPPLSQKPQRQNSEPDYVISPIMTKPNATPARPQVKEGQLIDLGEPEVKPSKAYPAHKSKLVKQSSFDKDPKSNQEPFNLHVHVNTTRPTEVPKQVKTNKPSGQYSLVGALESPESADKDITNPFDDVSKEFKSRGRNSLGMVEAVSQAGAGKLEKPSVAPRRLSEGSNVACTKNTPDKFFGTYSVVNEKKAAKEQENTPKPQPLARPDHVKPYSESTHQRFHDKSSLNTSGPIQKAHSTENVNTPTGSKRSNVDSDYSLVSSPYLKRKSDSSNSALYTSADSVEPLKTKPPLGLRRSNSGVLTTTGNSNSSGNVEGLYATVGARSKKRIPLSTDTWVSNGDLHSKERDLTRSQNSTSSLRSVTSTSSNDSTEDLPPVPVKTVNAFISPDDEDAYEAVQRSSIKSSTMDRFKSKARSMMNSGSQVPKISLGKRSMSPLSTPRSASPVLGEKNTSFPSYPLGYGNRVTKPSGPRRCPEHWPKF